jgi:hypothetical protein
MLDGFADPETILIQRENLRPPILPSHAKGQQQEQNQSPPPLVYKFGDR